MAYAQDGLRSLSIRRARTPSANSGWRTILVTNWSLEVYNPYPGVMENAPASNDYQPGFMVDLMVKDLGLAMEVAEQSGVDNALGRLASERYTAHQQAGNGPRDFSSILEMLKA